MIDDTITNPANETYHLMTSAPVEKLIVKQAIPTITIMMVSGMYNMADTYFVSFLGTSAVAAVGVSFSLMAVIQAVGFFFGHGSGNFISRALGARNAADAEKMAATGFFSAFILGLGIAVSGIIFLSPLARFLGSTNTILPYARDYLRFILLGAPFMVSSLMQNNLLRYQGRAFFGMIGMVSGAVLNIGLDPLFIFVFHLGIKGASLATMISQTLSCILLFVVGYTGRGNARILPGNFSPSLNKYKEIIRGGSPSLLRQSIAGFAAILLNNTAGAYGDAVIAAISIVNRVFIFTGSAIIGFGQGFQPVCGFNYGAKHYDRVKKAFWFCLRFSTVLLIILAAACFILAPDIISLFRKDDPKVVTLGAFALRAQCFSFPFLGWILLVGFMLQTMGKGIPASILAFSRQGLFLIPFIFFLVPGLGVLGIQICAPLADFFTFLLSLPLGIRTLRKDLA
ncbi:MAG: MATE family efflux transporter [Spirochaetaceae bacterium]|jgi:putative MATE family efflux protein|nr:MATE family efflux transporter [Spirochaetaceae bacterium]